MKSAAVYGNKIIVIGCPGSGKSTFSLALHGLTGLPLYHLDMIWWKPDRTHITREAFDKRLQAILDTEQWIIDGSYSRTQEMRVMACDTVIFLDFDEATCLEGIQKRVGSVRPDMPWVEESLDPELVALVKSYRTEQRPKIDALKEKYPNKNWLIFTSRKQADEWLELIK